MWECQGNGKNGKCNDQVAFNRLLLKLDMHWNIDPFDQTLPRISGAGPEMEGLLVDSFAGVSNDTGIRIKVWDRDFATRWSGSPKVCPSSRNWVAMPTKMSGAPEQYKNDKVMLKLVYFDMWDKMCGPNGTNLATTAR